MRISRRVSAFVWLLILCGAALGQTAEVTHNVNLRSDPLTINPPTRLLTPPEQFQLLEAGKTNDYYHVRTSVGEEGWVWSLNVHILPATPTPRPTPPKPTATPGSGITPSPPATPSGVATLIQPSWPKGTPIEATFTGASGTCGPDGDPNGDPETNHLKNRVDEPAAETQVQRVPFRSVRRYSRPSSQHPAGLRQQQSAAAMMPCAMSSATRSRVMGVDPGGLAFPLESVN